MTLRVTLNAGSRWMTPDNSRGADPRWDPKRTAEATLTGAPKGFWEDWKLDSWLELMARRKPLGPSTANPSRQNCHGQA